MNRYILMCVFACTPLLSTATPHKEVDLRSQSDIKGDFSISLCARASPSSAGVPGHAFVSYSFKPTSGERSVVSLGFTTNSAVKGVLSFSSLLAKPSGYLGEEKYTAINEECLVLLVNESDFNRAVAVAEPFYDVPPIKNVTYAGVYSLTSDDCITFMTDVAKQFTSKGLILPIRNMTDFPLDYMRKLIDAN